MPYRKKYNPRRRRPRRKTKKEKIAWYKKKYSLWELAMKGYAGAKYISGLVNSEMFTHNVTYTSATITSSGAVTHLNAIATGDGDGSRTGNSIFQKWLSLKLQAVPNATATQNVLRCMIVIDRQQVGDTAPGVSDILDTANATYDWLAFLNKNQRGRFTVLYDKVMHLDTTDRGIVPFKINIPLKLHSRYNGTNATDIQKNGLYFLAISDQPTNGPTLQGEGRLGYHDN